MDIEEYEKLYNFEEKNWWFIAKRRLIFGFLKNLLPGKKSARLLDVGCGTGIIVENLRKWGTSYGVDLYSEALRFCRLRKLKDIIQASAAALPFKNNTFDIVGCFDVLYHEGIKDDTAALKEVYRVCKKNGHLIITDSAMKCLWSKHDIIQHARTRYERREIRKKLKRAGFKIKKLSYNYFFTFIPLYISRKLDYAFSRRKKPMIETYRINKSANYLLDKLMQLEYLMIKTMDLPFGSSIFCVAKKE